MAVLREHSRKLSVAIVIGIAVALGLLSVIIAVNGYREFTQVLEKQYNDTAYEVAETAKSYLDPDKLEAYLYTGKTDGEYDEILQRMDELVVAANCNFIYVAKIDADSLTTTYIFDAVNPKTGFDRYPLGVSLQDTDPKYTEDLRHILETGGRAEKYLYSYSQSGAHTTAGLGVCDSSGEVVAVVGVEKPMTILENARSAYVKHVAMIALAAVILTITVYLLWISHILIRPIAELAGETERFARSGEVGEPLKALKNRYETGMLAASILKMERDINSYIDNITKITAEKERIGAELDIAANIQKSMLPGIFPAFPERNEFDIYASMAPAKEVGGDFYDFFLVDEDHLAMVMADVSGKGVPAALFMMISKTLIKNAAQMKLSPKEVLEKVNNQLCENNDAQLFVTVWLGIMELSTGKMKCASAGHEYPAVRRKDGEFALFKDKHGFVLAGMEGARYQEYELNLQAGDCLFVYTDGVAEATDQDNRLYGTERMIRALNSRHSADSRELIRALHEDIQAFVGSAPQFDDITMLCMKYQNGGK